MKNNLLTNLKYRMSILKYSEKHSITKASIYFDVSRSLIYKLKSRFDGSIESIKPHSKRPHSHPNQSTDAEYSMIRNFVKRNPDVGLIILWAKLRMNGYSRSITTLYRSLIRLGLKTNPPKPPKKKRVPYNPTFYPGERIQIDIKFIPKDSITNPDDSRKYYQYTAIDEYSRFRYLEVFDEISSYNSSLFIKHVVRRMPFPIKCVQTDNGVNFTHRFTNGPDKPTLFQLTLSELGITHRLIKPYTPRHNGKVERSHRKDKMYFYHNRKFMDINDLKTQLVRYVRNYNNFPIQTLKFKSPIQVLNEFNKDIKT